MNPNPKTRTLALANGILGIAGGGLYLSSLSKFHRPPLRLF